jgi:hypothetical protein
MMQKAKTGKQVIVNADETFRQIELKNTKKCIG